MVSKIGTGTGSEEETVKLYYLVTIEGRPHGLAGFKDGCMLSLRAERENFVLCNYEFVDEYDYGMRGGSMSNAYLAETKEPVEANSLNEMVKLAKDIYGWDEGELDVLVLAPQSLYRKAQGEVELNIPLPLRVEAKVKKHDGPLWELFTNSQ